MMKKSGCSILENVFFVSSSAFKISCRALSGTKDLNSEELTVIPTNRPKSKPNDKDNLPFGHIFTDHMLSIHWRQDRGWGQPRIQPYQNLSISPACKVFHYAQELYEGMKAYRGVDGKTRLFRPDLNMRRMNMTAERSCLPTFDSKQLLECIRKLVLLDKDWVPKVQNSSLYIRPTIIGTEPTLGLGPANQATLFVILSPVGAYFGATKAVTLLCDPRYVRATPGGCGYTKMGSNYAPTLWVQKAAEKEGCEQVLWVFGEDQEITEVGAMNIFILLRSETGEAELVTPPLSSGTVLPGVTRQSVLELSSNMKGLKVSERRITLPEVLKASKDGRLMEVFGCGTAAVVSPVGGFKYNGELYSVPTPQYGLASQMLKSLTDIYYGRIDHEWGVDLEATSFTETSRESAAFELVTADQPVGVLQRS